VDYCHVDAFPFYCGFMLELSRLDLDEIATALSDQADYDHRWLIDPRSGQVAFWTSDTGLDGEHPVDLEDVHLTRSIRSRRTSGTKTWPTLPTG
jgi:hypothetical protein